MAFDGGPPMDPQNQVRPGIARAEARTSRMYAQAARKRQADEAKAAAAAQGRRSLASRLWSAITGRGPRGDAAGPG